MQFFVAPFICLHLHDIARWINSLWPSSDTIWWHRYGSALSLVIASCWRHQAITWTSVSSIKFHGTQLRPISQDVLKISIRKMSLKSTLLKLLQLLLYRGQWVNKKSNLQQKNYVAQITCYWFRVSTCFTYSKEWNQLPCCLFTVYSICYVSHCRVLALPNRQRGSFLWRSLLNSRSRWSSLRPVFIKLSQSTRTSNRKLISLGIWYECSTHCILTHWSWVMHMRQ